MRIAICTGKKSKMALIKSRFNEHIKLTLQGKQMYFVLTDLEKTVLVYSSRCR